MPAEVESMMIVGQPAWHGLGTQVSEEDARDWHKAYVAAGLDWTVEQRPIKAATESGFPGLDVTSHVANVRTSDSQVLGVVGASYQVLQNESVFSWFTPFLEAGTARFEAAGSLKGGSRIWALAKIEKADAEVRPGDEVRGYVLLSHAHDGSLAIRVGFTPVRVVCSNTLAAAHAGAASKLIKIRHRGDVEANLRTVRETMDLVRQGFFASVDQYRRLAAKEISQKDVQRYVELVLDVQPSKQKDGSQGLSTKAQNIVDRIVARAYAQGPETVEAAAPLPLWDAYNGVTEWLSWERGRSQDNRLNSVWYGDGSRINARALELAVEMAS